MKKQTNFKKLLAAISLLTIAAPASLTVIACGTKHSQSKQPVTNSEWVIYGINNITYKLDVMVGLNTEDLKRLVNYDFIKEQLDVKIQEMFEIEDFTVNKITDEKGKPLASSDFSKIGMIKAKINYDYAEHKNQTTNLIIKIHEKKILLRELFKDFKFVDQKNVKDFLDSTNLNVITKQVLAKLKVSSLEAAKISLVFLASNSIVLQAEAESEYAGEVILSWNLKLFELYGIDIENPVSENEWIKQGLKGFFYLEKGTNQVKYFDAVWYFHFLDRASFHQYISGKYHQFYFINQIKKEKNFVIEGKT